MRNTTTPHTPQTPHTPPHTPPPGYKNTPLGPLPHDWKVVKLGEVAEINPKTKFARGQYSFVPMADVSEDGIWLETNSTIDSDFAKGYTVFKDQDILIAKITPCFENGKGALISSLENGFGFGSTEFHVLRSKKTVNNLFLYLHTRTDRFRELGTQNMTGSAGQKRVPTLFIKNYPLPLPPLWEQERIAAVLGAWDRAIALQQQLLHIPPGAQAPARRFPGFDQPPGGR